MTLGEKIRAARLEQKLTQEQLGGRDFTKYLAQMRVPLGGPRDVVKVILITGLCYPPLMPSSQFCGV